MELKEGNIVMCTVSRIESTTVFLKIEDSGEGSMVMSEVAAGRIRNLREYVFPNKKIVCKILKIDKDNHIHLSLRRVTGKEREEVLEIYKKEKTFENILKAIFKDPTEIIKKIKEDYELVDFFDKIKEDIKLAAPLMSKSDLESLKRVLVEKKEKEKEVKKIFILKSFSESGLNDLKEILETKNKEVQIKYLGSSHFSISATAKDYKEADHLVQNSLKEIESKSKDKKAQFEYKEK